MPALARLLLMLCRLLGRGPLLSLLRSGGLRLRGGPLLRLLRGGGLRLRGGGALLRLLRGGGLRLCSGPLLCLLLRRALLRGVIRNSSCRSSTTRYRRRDVGVWRRWRRPGLRPLGATRRRWA